MIGAALQKLARENNMSIAQGVAYGNLRGYAVTLCEGAGYKKMEIATWFTQIGSLEMVQAALNDNVRKQYRIQNLGLAARRITVVFTDTVGTMKKLQAFMDWFFPLLDQAGAVRAGHCPDCGNPVENGSWYLIGESAYYMDEACAQRVERKIQEENEKLEEEPGSYWQGTLGAFVGAALGALVWALVLSLGYVASIVGFVIGWLAEKGYSLCKGRKGKGKIIILILAVIFGVTLGTFLADGITLAQMIGSGELPGYTYGDIPALILYLLQVDAEYLSATVGNVGMGLLFAAIGVMSLLRKAGKEVAGTKCKRLG